MLKSIAIYFTVNRQWGHLVGGLIAMFGVWLIAHWTGNNQPVAFGYVAANLWYYSRALIEHEREDPKQVWWKTQVILYWDAWRSSKFAWAFVPTSVAALVSLVL